MLRVTEFTNPRMAYAFVDYMATQGIKLHIEQQQNYVLFLDDEQKLDDVNAALQQFIRDPSNPRYLAASWQSGRAGTRLGYPKAELWRNIKDRAGPLTLTVMALVVITYLLLMFIGEQPIFYWLSWPANNEQGLQVWRWISHIFIHFSLLQIMFNLMWWWYLGGVIEKRLGSGKLFVITVISALLSGWMQAKFSGIWFGGLSGVVYALMGYSWLRGERDPDSGIYLERGLIVFALLWLVAGYYGVFGNPMSNMAYIVGLVIGLAMAFVDSQAALKKRK
ncbi:rhomboid family intramembrane serine protease GlpG [Rosenbergiella nectarea]|uniref:rhomboid family intramembrane serine protease GlpG n=1 Tax=Rosenbergiella nectarea TaxID=988801 RepID=UPI001BD9CE29|nr:rhomboid family intramembrane serine protease GlpG [Rosenbergiella nectarea]MBT0730856.1 rhomboid family intramembrane serine protease GlpG [Rosenbergiella nectarea subsp. apis]